MMIQEALTDSAAIAAFAGSVWLMSHAYRYSRDRYLNFFYGLRFRTWALDCGKRVLADPGATEAARSAALSILEHLYDIRPLVNASPIASRDADSALIEETCGVYAHDLREALNCLVVLAVLEDRRLGSALRTLLGNVPAPTDIQRGLGQASIARAFDEAVDAAARLPAGRRFMTALFGSTCSATKAA